MRFIIPLINETGMNNKNIKFHFESIIYYAWTDCRVQWKAVCARRMKER